MRKILLAFDGTNFSKGAFEFARRMNQHSPILLTGVFLPQINYANIWSYAGTAAMSPMFIPLVEDDDTIAIEKNIARFEGQCEKNKIQCRVHKDFTDFALPALMKETRFADLLIIGSESFYENLGVNELNESVRDALHGSECPVLVIPEKFEFPQSNILAYDGSQDSVFAIKQFAYLFPDLCNNKSLLVYVQPDGKKEFPDASYIEELTRRHFPDLSLLKLEINPSQFFTKWVADRNGAILISGAFSRSVFSVMLKKSFVTDVIRDHRLPVFVAHR
ncbi:MAG TPA: universal stress protein [Chitinophagaceae bacterium]|nr:universal stress protein [Chitinophagaceae bacterium]